MYYISSNDIMVFFAPHATAVFWGCFYFHLLFIISSSSEPFHPVNSLQTLACPWRRLMTILAIALLFLP